MIHSHCGIGKRTAGPAYPSCSHPGDERRQLSPQTQPPQTALTSGPLNPPLRTRLGGRSASSATLQRHISPEKPCLTVPSTGSLFLRPGGSPLKTPLTNRSPSWKRVYPDSQNLKIPPQNRGFSRILAQRALFPTAPPFGFAERVGHAAAPRQTAAMWNTLSAFPCAIFSLSASESGEEFIKFAASTDS